MTITLHKIVVLIIVQISMLNSCIAQNNNDSMKTEMSLVYRVKEAKSTSQKLPLLILLHGYGSNENDLFTLNEKVPDNWQVVSVRGPYKLSENSYRWYDVKMENGVIRIGIEQEEESRKKLKQLISELTKKYSVDSSKIIVAGFSQGANMAQSLGLSEPDLIAGFGVFSGRYIEELTPYISNSPSIKKSKAFVSHGSNDSLLPKIYSEENIRNLIERGIEITYSEDTNGHSISSKQFEEFLLWLKKF